MMCYICKQEGRTEEAACTCDGCKRAVCRGDSVRTIGRLTFCNLCEAGRAIAYGRLAQGE